MQNLKLAQYDVPTPIQAYAIPAVLQGYDIVAIAQAGEPHHLQSLDLAN